VLSGKRDRRGADRGVVRSALLVLLPGPLTSRATRPLASFLQPGVARLERRAGVKILAVAGRVARNLWGVVNSAPQFDSRAGAAYAPTSYEGRASRCKIGPPR
jgi:hypothetical protein